MQEPYGNLFKSILCIKFGAFLDKIAFITNLASNYKIAAGTAPFSGAIWDEFSE